MTVIWSFAVVFSIPEMLVKHLNGMVSKIIRQFTTENDPENGFSAFFFK